MADEPSMARDELLGKAQLSDDGDFLREGVRVLAQALMEVEVTQQVGANRYERTTEPTFRTPQCALFPICSDPDKRRPFLAWRLFRSTRL